MRQPLKVGNSLDELRDAKRWLADHDVEVEFQADHNVSQSLYFRDPDGNQLEFFVDNTTKPWRADPQLVATIAPLAL